MGTCKGNRGTTDLARAGPLMLTALCTALPARLGLIVIGGEGALVVGAVATVAAAAALAGAPSLVVTAFMMLAGMGAGALALFWAMPSYPAACEALLLLGFAGGLFAVDG